MTDKLHCPFCGADLLQCGVADGDFSFQWHCETYNCFARHGSANKEVWRALIDGKKSQDALKVAISALGLVGNGKSDEQGICRFVDEWNTKSVRDICRNALENIKTITKQEV